MPLSDPQAAATELERAVTGLGHVGAMLFPRVGETFLDDITGFAYDITQLDVDDPVTLARWIRG